MDALYDLSNAALALCWPALLITLAIVLVRWVVAFSWHGLRAVQVHRVEMAQRWLDVKRQRADVELVTLRPGEIRIARAELSGTAGAQFQLALANLDAMRLPENVPHSVHYAPHIARVDPPAQPMAQIETVQPPAHIPTFAELLANGSLGGGRFLLGCDLETGRAITGTWKELYSTALGGLTGTGKSTTARFLLAQADLNGCKFVVLDPHAGAGDDSLAATLAPLTGSMLCEPASEDRAILDAARYIGDMGRKRIQGDGDRTPVIVCIDETTALLSRSTVGGPLGELIETIAQEYRKVGIFALCSAQIWLAQRSGGNSALRDSFASAYVHRMKRNQARLLLPTDDARRVETLDTGQAILWRTSGETQTIVIPNTTAGDVEAVAHRTGVRDKAQNQLSTLENGAFGGGQLKTELAGVFGPVFDAKAQQVIAAFEAGQTLRQIATDVYGVAGGANYNATLAEIQNVLRQHMQYLRGGTNGG